MHSDALHQFVAVLAALAVCLGIWYVLSHLGDDDDNDGWFA